MEFFYVLIAYGEGVHTNHAEAKAVFRSAIVFIDAHLLALEAHSCVALPVFLYCLEADGYVCADAALLQRELLG